jgi:glycosyltransferase involved in cell wall biosynthesis
MKIVFLAPFGIRPKGTVIARMVPLAAAMQALGHEVVIVAPPYTNPEDSGKTEELRGVVIRNIHLGPKNRALAAPLLAWRLFRAALGEKPDLLHLFKPKGYGGLAAMLLMLWERFGVQMPPIFLDSDDWEGRGGINELLDYSLGERYLYAFQERWLPRRMAGVTVASRELEDIYLAMGVGRERLLYLPNCVEERPPGEGSRVRERYGIAADAPVLLLYTRFFEFEQERLYQVLAGIYRRLTGVRFLVVGKGRHGEDDQLAAAAQEKGFHAALAVAGWVVPGELPDFLAAGDVAVYPFDDTLVNRAKCPAKLTELLCSGVPVVADRVGQIPEYLAPGLHRLLCDPGDRDEMVDKCVQLLIDKELCRKASLLGKEFILDNFSWREYAKRLGDFYMALTYKEQSKTRGFNDRS